MTPPEPGKSTAVPTAPVVVDASKYQRWIRNYSGDAGVYNELLADKETLRPAWARFLGQLAKIRPGDFDERWNHARNLIQENGVTFNVHGDPDGQDRPWRLDPVPLVLSATDWSYLEKSLIQRASLYRELLTDLYGPRSVVESGALPAGILYGNDSFLRSCVGLPAWQKNPLPFYAADVVRSPDGRWWVVSDRTQAPSGMGYALENRIVLGSMLPQVARECQLVRVAGFFNRLRESLAAASPRPSDQPFIILLTSGPKNETYFEQAYLARFLGITLAQGEDITVRANVVYLKTLTGLRRVDVVWRRIDESASDPLELRSNSRHGVSGLIQAARAGNVTILNPPGTGVAESPALMAFLPGLCRQLLGEDLAIPSVATWWCGQEKPLKHVLENVDHLVVKNAFHKGMPVLFGRGIEEKNREQLRARIAANPERYVAQEEIPYSNAPVWDSSTGFASGQVVMRIFLVAHGDSYVAMPGGLTRFSDPEQGENGEKKPRISMQQGSGSKDTWVLSDHPREPQISAVQQHYPIEIHRTRGQFPSRVADNFFWLGRYAERSEFAARLLRDIIVRLTSEDGFAAITEVGPVWDFLIEFGHLEALLSHAKPAAKGYKPLQAALVKAVFDPGRPSTLHSLNTALMNLGRTSRDSLSMDTWRIVRKLGKCLTSPPGGKRTSDLLPQLDQLINLHAAFSGLAQENTTRTPAWAFLDLGRRLERATYAAGLGRQLLAAPEKAQRQSLDAMLEAFDSSITYRQRYFFEPRLLPVLDTLLLDPGNPRSLAFQIERLDSHLAGLPLEAETPFSTPGRKLSTALIAGLRAINLSVSDAVAGKQALEQIGSLLLRLETELPAISEDLTLQYFSLFQPEQVDPESLITPAVLPQL